MRVKVNLVGILNDHKFMASGHGFTDPSTGEAKIELQYSDCPPKWNPLLYSDPLALLPGYVEKEGGLGFLSLTQNGFQAYVNYDFSNGFILRKTATIRIKGDVIVAVYAIAGTLHLNDKIESIEPFEEYLIPLGRGIIGGCGIARWNLKGDECLEAFVSSKYVFEESKNLINNFPQIRKFDVSAKLSKDGLTYSAKYNTSIVPFIIPDLPQKALQK